MTWVTNPTGTCLVLVLVTWGAVTVTTEALEMPLKTVTGAGVLKAVAVVTAAELSPRSIWDVRKILTDHSDSCSRRCAD